MDRLFRGTSSVDKRGEPRSPPGFAPGQSHATGKVTRRPPNVAIISAALSGDILVRASFAPVALTVALTTGGLVISAAAGPSPVTLPNGWILDRPTGASVQTGTMPQGMAA